MDKWDARIRFRISVFVGRRCYSSSRSRAKMFHHIGKGRGFGKGLLGR
jgi:hypothetical protein